MPAITNTSQFSGMSRVSTSVISLSTPHIGNQQQDAGRTRDERASRRARDYAAERRKYQHRERCVVETVVCSDCASVPTRRAHRRRDPRDHP